MWITNFIVNNSERLCNFYAYVLISNSEYLQGAVIHYAKVVRKTTYGYWELRNLSGRMKQVNSLRKHTLWYEKNKHDFIKYVRVESDKVNKQTNCLLSPSGIVVWVFSDVIATLEALIYDSALTAKGEPKHENSHRIGILPSSHNNAISVTTNLPVYLGYSK